MALDPSTIYVNQIDLPYVGAIRGQLIICLEDAAVYVASGIAGVLIPVAPPANGTPSFATLALLNDATGSMTAGTVAVVYADANAVNNTVYVWDGQSLLPVGNTASGARVYPTLALAIAAEAEMSPNIMVAVYADPIPTNNTVYVWDGSSLTPALNGAPKIAVYATLADLVAAEPSLPHNIVAGVYNDSVNANNGMYVWTGATLVPITPTPTVAKIYATLADLNAATPSLDPNTLAAVYADTTAVNNTTYVWDGSALTSLNASAAAIADLQAQINSLSASIAAGIKPYATKAALVADEGNLSANTMAMVYADATPANNTTYVWTGTALITAYDRLSVALGNGAGFQQSGTNAQIRPFQSKIRDYVPTVTDFYIASDGSDYYPALVRAYAYSKTIFFPPGTFNVNTPLSYTTDCVITGAGQDDNGTIINAPNGFLKNTSTTRHHLNITGLMIQGTGAGVAVDGPFGGFMSYVSIDSYATAVENSSAFLSHYWRCNFTKCSAFGLNVADFNGSSVVECYFDAYTPCHISLLDVTPTSGTNNGIPFLLQNNNHNVSGNQFQNISALRLRGQFEMRDCYIEDFGSSADGICMLEVEVGQFDKVGCSIHNNLFNGHGWPKCAICFWGSTNVRCDYFGSVFENKISGFATADILFGKPSDGTNNHIAGIQFLNNQVDTSTPTYGNQDIHYIYRPLAHGNSTASTTIAGATYVTLPIGANIVTDTAGGMGSSSYTVRSNGIYRISCSLIARSTSGSYPNIGAGIFVAGTEVEFANCAITYQSNPTQQMMTLDTILNLTTNQVVQIKAHNGETINNISFSIEWISKDGQG